MEALVELHQFIIEHSNGHDILGAKILELSNCFFNEASYCAL